VRFLSLMLALVWSITGAGIASAQEPKTDRVQQGLVGGSLVSVETQEQYGLLSLAARCSASLVRNNWAITAAHCVDKPDPTKPGEFITVPEDSVTLTANWKTVQTQKSVRIISFRPLDVALIRVANPFTVNGSNRAYNREIFRGSLSKLKITAFGRGIFQFAQGSGTAAMTSQRDGQYRMASFTVDEDSDGEYSYPSASGQMIAGGDSGGPSFTSTSSGDVLVGVHSSAEINCLSGKTCDKGDWDWIASTPRTYDASVVAVWDDLDRYLGAFVPEPLPIGVKPTKRVKLPPTGAPARPICDVAREALARKSPAAPGLRNQCLTFAYSLAAKGEAIASQDPLALQLRNQRPEGATRHGFDIGMAAAEGQTAPGPGKDFIRDLLNEDEREGFMIAVSFSLMRNMYADRASKGAAIATKDPVVAAARNERQESFFQLGFDIATAIFGNPALGGQGNTATGPGSMGIRDSLTAAGKRGFDAAVRLHLSRKY